jgi:hypothetical protein
VTTWFTILACRHCTWEVHIYAVGRRQAMLDIAEDYADHVKIHEKNVSPVKMMLAQWEQEEQATGQSRPAPTAAPPPSADEPRTT